MSLPHLASGDVFHLQTPNAGLPEDATFALVKTSDLEVIRMVLPPGKSIAKHAVPGKITVQCISGHALLAMESETRDLKAGDWIYLDGGQVHSLEALDHSVILVTLLLTAKP